MNRRLSNSVVLIIVGAACGLTQTVSAPLQVSINDLGSSERSVTTAPSVERLESRSDVRTSGEGSPLSRERGTLTDIGPFFARGLNDQGQVFGNTDAYPGNPVPIHAYFWERDTLTELGGDAPTDGMYPAVAINDRGQVLGRGSAGEFGEGRVLLWERGTLTDLLDLSSSGEPVDINNRGQVLLRLYLQSPAPFPHFSFHCVLLEKGALTDLGTLGGGGNCDLYPRSFYPSRLKPINDRGQVVGTSNFHAFLWETGAMTDLGTLGGGDDSAAFAINNQGQVVGGSITATGEPRLFLWEKGTLTDLGVGGLGCPGDNCEQPQFTDVNDRGQVVGVYPTALCNEFYPCHDHGFLWERGTLTDLGPVLPSAINNHGQVVVRYVTATGEHRLALWENGTMTDLGVGGVDTYGDYINDRGQIVGTYITATGQYFEAHSFLWEARGSRHGE